HCHATGVPAPGRSPALHAFPRTCGRSVRYSARPEQRAANHCEGRPSAGYFWRRRLRRASGHSDGPGPPGTGFSPLVIRPGRDPMGGRSIGADDGAGCAVPVCAGPAEPLFQKPVSQRGEPPLSRSANLERNVVVQVGQIGGFRALLLLLSRSRTLLRRACRSLGEVTATGTAHFVPTTTQHLHLVGDDFRGVAVLAGFLVLPLAGLDAAFHVDGAALAQIFACNFGQTVVEHHTVPFGFFTTLAGVAVLPGGGGGQRDVADRRAIRAVANFRIAAKIADEYDFVDGGHVYTCELNRL